MKGLHLTADLYGCRCDGAWLGDADALGGWCLEAAAAVGLAPEAHLFHAVAGAAGGTGRVTVTAVLADGHLCIHTWPAQKAVSCDVYACHLGEDHSAQARGLMFALVNRFQPEWTEQRSLDRGDDS